MEKRSSRLMSRKVGHLHNVLMQCDLHALCPDMCNVLGILHGACAAYMVDSYVPDPVCKGQAPPFTAPPPFQMFGFISRYTRNRWQCWRNWGLPVYEPHLAPASSFVSSISHHRHVTHYSQFVGETNYGSYQPPCLFMDVFALLDARRVFQLFLALKLLTPSSSGRATNYVYPPFTPLLTLAKGSPRRKGSYNSLPLHELYRK